MDRTFKLVLILALATGIAYHTKDKWRPTVESWVTGNGINYEKLFGGTPSTFAIKRVQVVRGDQFDLLLEDDSRVMAKLKVVTADSAKSQVIDLLNRCENPKVRLVKKQSDGTWLVDFLVTVGNQEIDLAVWLADKKLVFKQ